nr:MAG TPA: hypothetical protein [Caudoviricetes sp.]
MKTNLHTGKPDIVTKKRPFRLRVEFCRLVCLACHPIKQWKLFIEVDFVMLDISRKS